jgi:hypothetical protein
LQLIGHEYSLNVTALRSTCAASPVGYIVLVEAAELLDSSMPHIEHNEWSGANRTRTIPTSRDSHKINQKPT